MVKLNMQKIAVIGDGITGKLASVAFSELGYLVDLIALNQKKKKMKVLLRYLFQMIALNFCKN